ncbi:diacylglycerol O-acyltransferase 1-like [Gordionus sp. m RMFG-2023]|uniref:diacylglycerol O-acyltransferase 1-like n=1 Tax=Gordionus sp. m RMFG-2023 TaxID=3053472 RepID=UPI0031FC5682
MLEPTTNISKIKKHNRKEKKIHHAKESLFTSSSGFGNYRGLFNLAMILLVISHSRLALENVIKYGILVDPIAWLTFFLKDPYHWPCTCLLLFSNVYAVSSFAIEKMMSKHRLNQTLGLTLQAFICINLLTFPAIVLLLVKPNPIAAVLTLGMYTVIFLKLVSYTAVNKWCRDASRSPSTIGSGAKSQSDSIREKQKLGDKNGGDNNDEDVDAVVEKDMVYVKRESRVEESIYAYNDDKDLKILYGRKPVVYPDNLTLKDLYYFLLVPTFCYELNFPKTQRIRKLFLFKRVMEMIFLFQLMLGLIQQWIIPTINNAMAPFSSMDYLRMSERLLKLAIPNHLIWLIFFYWLFHSCFNAIAEIMYFADRNFYNDWWNAVTINEFWQSWNIPVHRWCSRHLYFPLLDLGVHKMVASVIVFMVSAFFHEYLLSVPLHMFRLWAFSGMLMQVPLAFLVSKYMTGQWGNILVWLSLILGQPICILMYFHDYYVINNLGK